jgi:hypothetical protein
MILPTNWILAKFCPILSDFSSWWVRIEKQLYTILDVNILKAQMTGRGVGVELVHI